MSKKDYIFCRLKVDRDEVFAVINEWRANHDESYYDITTKREEMCDALKDTRTYHLRKPNMNGVPIVTTESTQNVLDMVETPAYDKFPLMRQFVEQTGQRLFGGWTTLGRVFVTKLAPKRRISPHKDEGLYFDKLHRFHLVLDGDGSEFFWAQNAPNRIVMELGQLWVVNNSIMHWTANPTDVWRTHLIFDGV